MGPTTTWHFLTEQEPISQVINDIDIDRRKRQIDKYKTSYSNRQTVNQLSKNTDKENRQKMDRQTDRQIDRRAHR